MRFETLLLIGLVSIAPAVEIGAESWWEDTVCTCPRTYQNEYYAANNRANSL